MFLKIKTSIFIAVMQLGIVFSAQAELKLNGSEVLMLISSVPTVGTSLSSQPGARAKKELTKEDAQKIQEDIAIFEATGELTPELGLYSRAVMKIENVEFYDSLDVLDQVSVYLLNQ